MTEDIKETPTETEIPETCSLPETADKSAEEGFHVTGEPADPIKEPEKEPEAEEKPAAPVMTEVVDVCFRGTGKSYYFAPNGLTYTLGEPVVVETARGVEMGRIVAVNHKVDSAKINPPLRAIVRRAEKNDLDRAERNRKAEVNAAAVCREKITQHKLEMNLVDVEYTFDNSKLLFYFTSDTRVDFRDLVKDLASVFHTRIELRQIGIRDEAKMVGGLGACGRPFCCTTFLSDFVQVSIKMAKEQNFSLNSAKISGACGRLMCCLRYEHETYEAAQKVTPPNGSYVSTPNGNGVIVETRPLAGTVKVRLEEKAEAPKLYQISDITVLRSGRQKPQNRPSNQS